MTGRHLVIGASGQVGRALMAALAAREIDAVGTAFSGRGAAKLDLGDPGAIRALLDRIDPEVVWVVGAYTHVDGCEADPERSRRINRDGPAAVAAWAAPHGRRMVFFSTDYVFDGAAGPYHEDDRVAPLSQYGRDKLGAERALARRLGERALIVRTAWVYDADPSGRGFIPRVVASLTAGREVTLPEDQRGTPTYAPDLAAVALELLAGGAGGVWHVVGPEVMSRVEWGRRVAERFALDPALIRPLPTRALGQPAARPLLGGLLADRARRATGIAPITASEGLARVRTAMADHKSER